jgi:hypothetical protein
MSLVSCLVRVLGPVRCEPLRALRVPLRAALLAVVAVSLAGCAEKQKASPRPRAEPGGAGLFVAEPVLKTASGVECAAAVTDGIAPRFRSAAKTALTEVGFRMADAAESAAFVTELSLEVDYCSEAGIVSGTTALVLGRKDNPGLWRGQATGDQARGETALSTVRELVEQMLYDPDVVEAAAAAR